jgi:site-specific DNA-methyltransferase (adenine-specific)
MGIEEVYRARGAAANLQILHDDALDVLRSLGSGSVDAIMTDPPYFLPAEHYVSRNHERPRSLADLSVLEHFYGDILVESRRVLKHRGHCLIFCDAHSYPVFYVQAYRHFSGLAGLVWDKGKIGLGRPWRNQHEMILACSDRGAMLASQGQGTVLRFPVVATNKRIHPAEKPVELLAHLARLICPPGGLIVDPFAGGGSTGAACVREGRAFLGVERDEQYVAIARQRVMAEQLYLMEASA